MHVTAVKVSVGVAVRVEGSIVSEGKLVAKGKFYYQASCAMALTLRLDFFKPGKY